jgi:hypothetical protein
MKFEAMERFEREREYPYIVPTPEDGPCYICRETCHFASFVHLCSLCSEECEIILTDRLTNKISHWLSLSDDGQWWEHRN